MRNSDVSEEPCTGSKHVTLVPPGVSPTIAVAGDGTVGVTFFDFRNDTLGDTQL